MNKEKKRRENEGCKEEVTESEKESIKGKEGVKEAEKKAKR